MRQLSRTAALIAALLAGAAGSAHAADGAPSEQGFEVGFRTGVAIPVGDAASSAKLSNLLGLQFPLWVDLGYRFGPLVVGAYGQWAAGLLGRAADCEAASCSVSAWRAGLEVQVHPYGRRQIDPWVSLGFGYEWQTLRSS